MEFISGLFVRKHKPTPAPAQEEEIIPIFENDAREIVREIEERKPPTAEATDIALMFVGPEIKAPLGICLRKSVQFRTRRGEYMSAKVVGSDGEDLLLSRNNGPTFRRSLLS